MVTDLWQLSKLGYLDVLRLPGVGLGSMQQIVLALANAGLAPRNAPQDPWWVARRASGAIEWRASLRAWLRTAGIEEHRHDQLVRSIAYVIEREQVRGEKSPWEA